MGTTAMTKHDNTDMTFGTREDVSSLAKRIKFMVKGGDKLSENEAMALAQIAHVTGLNCFIGELWYIPGKGPMVGIAGARRLDNEEMAKKGGNSWPEFVIVSPEEAGAAKDEVQSVVAAYKCEIYDSIANSEYQKNLLAALEAMRGIKADDPFGAAKEIVGPRPRWIGYGYATSNEQSRMSKQQLARKRAESDARKKRTVIPFGVTVAPAEVAEEYVEGKEVTIEEAFPQPKRSTDEIVAELTNGTKEVAVNWNSPKIIEVISRAKRLDRETALQCLKEAHKNKVIGDMLTPTEAQAFAATINA